jgi:hypothetical protein
MYRCCSWFLIAIFFLSEVKVEAQKISLSLISENSGIHTDRRPVSVGYFDSLAQKTFICWMGPYSSAVVKAFDHTAGSWSPNKTVGISPFADSHNYPVLVRGTDGRLIIMYGCHNSVMRITSSPDSASIDGKWYDRELSQAQGASYPVPVMTDNGTLYCFYRITMYTLYPKGTYPVDYRPLGFVRSKDNGESWSQAVKIIDPYPRTDNLCEIYTGKITYQPAGDSVNARIHIAWSLAGGGPDHHEHGLYRRHVYYAWMDPADEHLYDIRGNDLGTDIDDSEAENQCKVIDTGLPPDGEDVGYQVSVHFCDNGDPVIIYRHVGFDCAWWNGTGWSISTIYAAGNEPRDIEKTGPESFRTYRTAGKSVYIFRTADGGRYWEQEDKITAPVGLARCYVIGNYRPELKLLLTEMADDSNNVEAGSRDIFTGGIADISSTRYGINESLPEAEAINIYPNPFNSTTNLEFTLPEPGEIILEVYNMAGQKILTKLYGKFGAGRQHFTLDASILPSGVYLCKLKTGSFISVRKIMLIR